MASAIAPSLNRSRSPARPASPSRIGPIAGFGLLLIIWWPFLSSASFDATQGDWGFRANYLSYTVTSLFTYREIPYWATRPEYLQSEFRDKPAPPHGFFSNPETDVLSPYVLLFAVLSFPTAVKVSFLLHVVVGLAGLSLLLNLWDVRHPLIVALSAVLLFGSAFFVRHLLVGHFQFVSFTYFPLALWLYWRVRDGSLGARTTWINLASCGVLLALAYYEGNAHLTLLFVVLLGVLSGFQVIAGAHPRRWDLPLKLAGVLVVFVCVAGFKLFPGIADYGGYVPVGTIAYLNPGQLVRYTLELFPAYPPRLPHEVSLYCGMAGAVVIGLGILCVRRANVPVALTIVTLASCMLLPVAIRLRSLPILGTQRLTRLRGEILMLAILLMADLLIRVERTLRQRLSDGVARTTFVAVLVALTVLVVNDEARAVRAVVGQSEPHVYALHQAAIAAPAAVICGDQAGTLTVTPDGPNAFSIAFRSAPPALDPPVICFPDISAKEGLGRLSLSGPGELTEVNQRLAVRLPPGTTTVRLRYSSFSRTAGLACSLLGLVAFGVLIGVTPARARRETLAGA